MLLSFVITYFAGCEKDEFKCDNGECLGNLNFVCDGGTECDDESDEKDCHGENNLSFHIIKHKYNTN